MTTQRSESILSNMGGIEHNNLMSILDIDTNEIIQMPPSLYFEMDELKTLLNNTDANKQLSILSMNIQSMYANPPLSTRRALNQTLLTTGPYH